MTDIFIIGQKRINDCQFSLMGMQIDTEQQGTNGKLDRTRLSY